MFVVVLGVVMQTIHLETTTFTIKIKKKNYRIMMLCDRWLRDGRNDRHRVIKSR